MEFDLSSRIAPFWQDVIEQIKDNLISSGKNSSGNTLQSIEAPRIVVGENTYNIKLVMPSYYAFLDEGVKGVKGLRRSSGKFGFTNKMPPITAMREFMRNRGIVGTTKRGQRRTQSANQKLNSIAFAIARSIYNKGIEQTDFYSNVVNNDLIDDFADKILNEIGRVVIIKLDL